MTSLTPEAFLSMCSKFGGSGLEDVEHSTDAAPADPLAAVLQPPASGGLPVDRPGRPPALSAAGGVELRTNAPEDAPAPKSRTNEDLDYAKLGSAFRHVLSAGLAQK